VASSENNSGTGDVRRRQVFYIPGYDPMLPRRYRELYRSEGRRQAEISGYELDLRALSGRQNYAWHVDAVIDGSHVETDFEFLAWSDLVRDSMERSIIGTFAQLARVVWIYVSSGALWRLAGMRKGPVIAALYPIFMLLAQLLVGAAAGALVWWAVGFFLPQWVGALAGLATLSGVMILFRRIDNRLFAYYLMHDYAFTALRRGQYPGELEQRIAIFVARLREALQSDADEVLLVGHSSGAHIGVSVLADLLRAGDLEGARPKFGFLTLGHVIPMVSFLPDAHRLRRDLHDLSRSDLLSWVDVTAPGDGCTFALVDPVSVCGAAPSQGQRWPLVISAAFSQTLAPQTWQRLKWRFFRVHFQYLCAFERPRDYDYFRITAGSLSLGRRFKGRKPSPSCLRGVRISYIDRQI